MRLNAEGDLKDSYVIPNIQLNDVTQFLSALFLDDGCYIIY